MIEHDSTPLPFFDATPERLTPRETEVVGLAEMHRAEIARALEISEHTVKAHLRSAYAKLNVRTRAQVVAWRERRAA